MSSHTEFRPIFDVSKDVVTICGNYREKTMLGIIKQFEPFSSISIHQTDNQIQLKKNNSSHLSEINSQEISKLIQENIAKNGLKFNDNQILKQFNETRQFESIAVANYSKDNLNEKNSSIDETSSTLDDTVSIETQQDPTESRSIKRQITFKRGIILEDYIRQQVNETEGMTFIKPRKKELDLEFCLLKGIGDGYDEKAKVLLEIKTRKEIGIKNADRIQIHCYMKMYSVDSCLFVQLKEADNIQNEEVEVNNIVKSIIEFDDSFWVNIIEKLKKFTIDAKKLSIDDFIAKCKSHSIF